jgi:predicted transcriptional regulator
LAPEAFDGYNAIMTTKELIRKLLDQMPDDATIEDVQYQIFVLQKIQAGEEDLEAGRIVTHDQVMHDLARWVK